MFTWLFSWVEFGIGVCIDVVVITVKHAMGHKERARILRKVRTWQRENPPIQ